MDFGVFDHMDSSGRDIGKQYRERLQLAEAYDEAGFYAYHLAEHHGTPLGLAPSPNIFLAALSEHTKTLRFGPMVNTLSIYHPMRAIEEICMLDQLSGGRLELGIGRGISPIEMGFYGAGPESKEIYEEVSEIILQNLSAERLNYVGKYFTFTDVPLVIKPVQLPHPPLWYGLGNADKTPWAAKRKMNIITNGLASVVRGVTDRFKSEWSKCSHASEPLPKIGMSRHVVIGDSDRQAHDMAAPAYDRWFASLLHLWRIHDIQIPLSFPEDFCEAKAQGHCVVGSVDTVRERLAEEIESSGINYLLCRLAFGNLPVEQTFQSVAYMKADIIPHFRDKSLR
jgi:alkanesulfonate monooxygenase SsuD/methylene tetrahydromethanopterin reductase-like flavin-dependent oxidoreductase (luciferase family)